MLSLMDLLITQKLITEPYFEFNVSSTKLAEQKVGRGLTQGNIGLETRYEITKKFAPYINFNDIKKFGATAALAVKNNQSANNFIASLGLRLWF